MLIFLTGTGAAFAYLASSTPMYRAEVRLLAQRQQALPSITRGAVPDDVPTRSAYELVHRRENILQLIKDTNLLGEPGPAASAPPVPETGFFAWIRQTRARLGTAATQDDPMSALVQRLDRALTISAAEGTITIAVFWPDPIQAYHLVEAALQNFLEARQLQEITSIDDTITLLQGRVATLREQLDIAILEARRDLALSAPSPSSTPATQDPSPVPGPATEELARLKAALDSKERAIRDVEELRRRRLFDLQTQLEEKRGIYSDAYPSVVSLRQEIAALAKDSPQIVALREEEKKLREAYASRTASTPRPRASVAVARTLTSQSIDQDERVRDARLKYQQMLDRLNAAQLDLDTARAAFKYRYSMLWPARVPTKPFSPNPVKIIGAGVGASLLLAILVAALPNLLSGKILEGWQVERLLGVKVLGRVNRP